ncbi:hypothetical protein [Chromobacterium aquaticum]|uniref:Uncharacterized protein n=1 Tax=Chromobacterium aquaticum TaxID=467180 RepID=A0ABV9A164_9NEIS|nr:hypothetical protein [Chromobacterium aquaticum]MCD5364067.1 hypothetical protein [Chromobacterium aquaticum]
MHARNYTELPEAGVLAIEYCGENLDMNAIAVIQLNLQAIAEKVAAHVTGVRISEDVRTAFSPGITGRFEYTLNPTIRLVPNEIRIGSLFEYVIPFVPILTDPDVRAAMQGVLGNIIFTIGNSTPGNYFQAETKGKTPRAATPQIEIGPNVAAIAVALAQHGPQGLTIRHKAPDGSVTEVEIKPNP